MVWYGMVRCFDTQRIPLDCFMCWFNTQFQAGVTNKRLEASTLGFLLGKNIRARIFFSFPQSCRMTASQILDSKTDGRRFMKMWFQTIDFFLNGLTLPNSSSHYSPRFSSPPTFRAVWWGIGWYLTDMSRHASTLRFSNASREVWMSIRPLINSTMQSSPNKMVISAWHGLSSSALVRWRIIFVEGKRHKRHEWKRIEFNGTLPGSWRRESYTLHWTWPVLCHAQDFQRPS